jgi:membrane protease YdiL (CAAX protease family)
MTRLDEMNRTRSRWWRRYVTDVVADVEGEAAVYTQVTPPRVAITKVAVVLVTSALSLTIINFFRDGADPGWLLSSMEAVGLRRQAVIVGRLLASDWNVPFNRLAFWAVVSVAGYVILPVVAIKLVLRERLSDFGIRVRGTLRTWRPYAVLFAVSVPFIVIVSFQPAFQAKYPFYSLAPTEAWLPYLWAWWGLYAVQFVGLEFFFRGFMVHGLRLRLGMSAVFVMMVPYAMIHFNKPLLEATAAIVGGTVLGFLSLKTGSVWWGAALHIAIAGTMDLLALAHAGLL